MRYPLAVIAARLAASLCLVTAGATSASAQVQCWMAPSAGPPIVDDAHILCGVINDAREAKGFHSRPGGVNPMHTLGVGAPVPIIGGGTVGDTEKQAPPGIYRLKNFTITMNGMTDTKKYSTMFPDACSAPSVLIAIRNAWTAAKGGRPLPPQKFHGPSGGDGACTADDGAQFNIEGYINGTGDVMTAYPDY